LNDTDMVFLDRIKIRCVKVFSIKDLEKLTGVEDLKLSEFLDTLTKYDVGKCVHTQIKINGAATLDNIFKAVTNCWVDDLLKEGELVSHKLMKFIKVYLSKYAITTVLECVKFLQGRVFKQPTVIFDELSGILSASNFSEVIEGVKLCKKCDASVVSNALYKYVGLRINEVSVSRLEGDLMDSYWRSLINEGVMLRQYVNLVRCLNFMKVLEEMDRELKRKLLVSEDVGDVLKRYDYSYYRYVGKHLQGANAIEYYDYVIAALRYSFTSSALTYSSLSYDVVLYYVILKEWESLIITFLLYSLIKGLDYKYVSSILRRWVEAYVSLH